MRKLEDLAIGVVGNNQKGGVRSDFKVVGSKLSDQGFWKREIMR